MHLITFTVLVWRAHEINAELKASTWRLLDYLHVTMIVEARCISILLLEDQVREASDLGITEGTTLDAFFATIAAAVRGLGCATSCLPVSEVCDVNKLRCLARLTLMLLNTQVRLLIGAADGALEGDWLSKVGHCRGNLNICAICLLIGCTEQT